MFANFAHFAKRKQIPVKTIPFSIVFITRLHSEMTLQKASFEQDQKLSIKKFPEHIPLFSQDVRSEKSVHWKIKTLQMTFFCAN